MEDDLEELWELVQQGSDELALALGVERFDPRALAVVDGWLAEREIPLDEEEIARLGLFLARLLLDTHGGGLTRIEAAGHPLDGEWAATGFTRGLSSDYHVPFVVSAARIGRQRALKAVDWYDQLVAEAGTKAEVRHRSPDAVSRQARLATRDRPRK